MTGVIAVRGHLYDEGTSAGLCERLTGGERYIWEGPLLPVEGLDLGPMRDDAIIHDGLAHTEVEITVLGEIVDGTLVVEPQRVLNTMANRTSRPRRWRKWAVLVVVGLVVAACGDSDDGTDPGPVDGEEVSESNRFVGLGVDEAAELAESEGRLWRVSRDGEEFFAMDASQVEGRITFEVDDGIVTAAEIETVTGPGDTDPDHGDIEDPVLAQLQADAVVRLVTVDHSFASDAIPFDLVIVSSVIADDPSRSLEPLALELIAAGVEADAAVKFTQIPDTEIDDLAASETGGVAVVRIEDVRIDGDRAEIDMGLWCGTVCAVFLTYEAELWDNQWTITGTGGPIAVS